MQRGYILLLFSVILPIVLFSQTISNQKIIHYNTENGLSNGKIHQITQDKQGFIWIATENGLTRFDGKQSKRFFNNGAEIEPYGITHNNVFSVVPAVDYGVWVGTMSGLNKYQHTSGKFSHYFFYTPEGKSYVKPVWQIVAKSSGYCFLRSDSKEIYLYTPNNDTLKAIVYKNFTPQAIPMSIDSFSIDKIIVGDKQGLIYTLNKSGDVVTIDKLPNSITCIKVLPQNLMLVADINGTISIFKNLKRIKSYVFPISNVPISEKFISAIEQINDTTIIIGTRGNGILYLNPLHGWSKQQGISKLLVNQHIESVFKDNAQNIWIGHSYEGVSLSLFSYQSLSLLDCPDLVFQHKVLAVTQDKNNVFIGTDGDGLFVFNIITKQLEHYNYQTGFKGKDFDNVVTSLQKDKTYLWVSTYNNGIFAINLQTLQLSFVTELSKIPVKQISNIYNDSKNRLWIGTYENGVFVYDKNKKVFNEHYTTKSTDNKNVISCNGTTCFYEDSKKNIWIGSYYGISKINERGEIVSYTLNTHKGIKNNLITTFCEDNNGIIWIGTSQGISLYDSMNDSISILPLQHKVNSNPIQGLFLHNNNMWIIGTQSIYEYNKDSNNLKFIGTSNIGEFSKEAFYLTPQNIFIAAEKGVVELNFSQIPHTIQKKSFELTDILVQGKSIFSNKNEYEARFINNEYHLYLPYKEDNVTIYFADFNFDLSHPEEYTYILENYMDEWVPLNDLNFVNFTKLSGGDYIFKVRKNSSNNPNDELRVYIHIELAFWEQWYFYVMVAIVILTIIYSIYTIRLKSIVTMRNTFKNQVDQRMDELHSKIEKISVQEQRIEEQDKDLQNYLQEIENQKNQLSKFQDNFMREIEDKDGVIIKTQQEVSAIVELKNEVEKKIRLLENNTNEMVFRIQLPSEQFEYVSPSVESLTGYTPQDFYDDSMFFRKLIISEGKNDFKKFRKYMIEGKVPPVMEYKIITKTEKEKWVAQHSIIVRDARKQVVALEAYLIDISDKKELEMHNEATLKRVNKISKMNETFQEGHQMNKVTNALTILQDLLLQENVSLDEIQPFLESNYDSSSFALHMIENFITISKIEAGKLHFNYSQCYVNTLLQELQDSFTISKNNMGKKHIVLQLMIPTSHENFSFYTDTYRFRQIMMNFIGNAIKYTQHGSVEFGYELIAKPESESNFELVFFIKDSGIGFSQEKIQQIFESKNSKESVQEQSGVGLFVAKKLIESLGGVLWVKSSKAEGTSIRFSLPIEKMKGFKKTETVSVLPVNIENKDWSEKILLLAEDEENNYDLVREVLSKTNISILWAKNGEEAVEIFKEKQRDIDIILMDIQMPIMNGFTATQEIKKIDKEIPIIAQTAYANYESKLNCIRVGCDNYIEKPYKRKELIELLAKYL
jgi:PAS domain S-box-containing protein